MEPLFYNPNISGRWGAATLDPETYALEQRQRKGAGASDPKICCWSQERDTDAKEVYDRSKRFAALGLTHIAHMLEPDGKLITWAGIKGLARSKETQTPCTPEEFDALYRGIPECWYEVLDLLAGGANTHNPPLNTRTHTGHTSPQRVMGVAHYQWHAHYHSDRRVVKTTIRMARTRGHARITDREHPA